MIVSRGIDGQRGRGLGIGRQASQKTQAKTEKWLHISPILIRQQVPIGGDIVDTGVVTIARRETGNPPVICYSKSSLGFGDTVIVLCNLDAFHTQSGWVNLDLADSRHPSRAYHEGATLRPHGSTPPHWSGVFPNIMFANKFRNLLIPCRRSRVFPIILYGGALAAARSIII